MSQAGDISSTGGPGDTAQVQINVAGGAKIINIYGAANDPRTFFEGMLIA